MDRITDFLSFTSHLYEKLLTPPSLPLCVFRKNYKMYRLKTSFTPYLMKYGLISTYMVKTKVTTT